jgi:hypothetical protein
MQSLRERIESDDLILDSAITSHGYAPYLRDYDVVVRVPAALPPEIPDGPTIGGYIMGVFRYRFTHCPEVCVVTSVRDEVWKCSWDDVFIDYAKWEAAGHPEGFVWGVNYGDAYPGISYVAGSPLAGQWAGRLGREMHEVMIETNTFDLRLVCHDLRVHKLAIGDPWTRTLKDLDEPEAV